MTTAEDDGSDIDNLGLFNEPDGFYAPDKPATFTTYVTKEGLDISLRLVGHNPLWGHLLWNAGQVIARYIEDNATSAVKDKSVLELGAGAGLPSLVCALNGAARVLVTDYPDSDLIENLRHNINHCISQQLQHVITAQGYLWGNDTAPLTSVLDNHNEGFDLLILADILFNHSEHEKLVQTVLETLRKNPLSRALIFFTPYRPWLLQKDLRFFDLAREKGLVVEKLFEHVMDKIMFPQDPGDEQLRRTVFAYQLRWPA